MNTPRTMQFSVVPDGTEIDNLGCPHEKGKVIIFFSKPRYQEKGKAILTQWKLEQQIGAKTKNLKKYHLAQLKKCKDISSSISCAVCSSRK